MPITSVILTVAVGAWLTFMIAFPRRWGAIVDLEYDFWGKTGLKKVLGSDRMRAFEKGSGLNVLVGALLIYQLALTIALFMLS